MRSWSHSRLRLIPRDTTGDSILMNLRGMTGMVEGAEVGLGLVEEEVGVVDIVKPRNVQHQVENSRKFLDSTQCRRCS